ncbi:MAG: MerR family transcriptional regulator [Myxococcota bacterium]
MDMLFTPAEIDQLEADNPSGLSSREIIEVFRARGVRLSEATFRKYVQMGLLPRSTKRVGEKGKHKGSRGVYPVGVVRRLNLIRKMMDEGMTLEEIRNSFLAFRNDIDALQDALDTLFLDFEEHLRARELPEDRRQSIARQFQETRRTATSLVRKLERIGSAIAAGPVATPPGAG